MSAIISYAKARRTTNTPEPNSAFKKGIIKAFISIIAFLLVYLLLFIIASCLAALSIYGGFVLILAVPRIITVLIGLGLAGMGAMVFVFLIKFLFAVAKHDRTGIVEVTETDQPRLFSVIQELTTEIGTQFPKKIFISPEVNACVFYDSSFWSMFFPVKKNLQIGLGLVNSLNTSEFKAVMAHEFGHFSQRSMKLGSFVYHVNRIIYNLLFENNSYGNFINRWASVGNTSALFANITVRIVQGIQWILRQMYGVVNKSYLQLSREMEFHADAVAASVCGSNNMIAALRRIEVTDACYNLTLQKCDELLKGNKRIRNIYNAHRTVLERYGKENGLTFHNDLLMVTEDFLKGHNLSRINYKDQWASHPTLQERADYLSRLEVDIPVSETSAWELFEHAELVQEQLSNETYKSAEAAKDALVIDQEEFAEWYNTDTASYSLPKDYKGFYNNRSIVIPDLNELFSEKSEKSFDEIFTASNIVLPQKIDALASDIEMLKAIASKNIDIKTFDFDGRRYKRDEAEVLVPTLEIELEKVKQQLKQVDQESIGFFYRSALLKSQHDADILKSSYVEYFELQKDTDRFLYDLNTMLESLKPVYSGQAIGLEEINSLVNELKTSGEKNFKSNLKKWIVIGAFYGNNTLLQRVEKFIDSDYAYFSGSSFFDHELVELNELVSESWQAVNLFIFRKFKYILEMQLQFITKTVNEVVGY
jgi:Zn-dependent protease with chaperone function